MHEVAKEFNPKSPLECALGLIEEECSEIIQIIEKIRRFGLDSKKGDVGPTNIEHLQKELLDLRGSITQTNAELLKVGRQTLTLRNKAAVKKKLEKVRFYSEISMCEGLQTDAYVFINPDNHAEFMQVFDP